jgi:hypothetical protein
MLASLPCVTAVCEIHAVVGFVIVGGWAALLLWGAGAFFTKREPNQWFWRLLGTLQAILILQIVVGLILLALGHRNDLLHYMYGSAFPAIVLVIANVLARGLDDEADRWKVFAVAAFFVFGLTLRALMTGLGLG